jgi:hypothetical protein
MKIKQKDFAKTIHKRKYKIIAYSDEWTRGLQYWPFKIVTGRSFSKSDIKKTRDESQATSCVKT